MEAIVIQARCYSKRLNNKILKKVNNKTLIEYVIERMLITGKHVVLAVPLNTFNKVKFLEKKYNITIMYGPEIDVLKRYYQVAKELNLDHIIRVTADNPFTSVTCLLELFEEHKIGDYDLSYHVNIPHGTGVEIMKFSALEKAHLKSNSMYEREHVTRYFYHNKDKFKINHSFVVGIYNNKHISLTIDTKDDFEKFKDIVFNVTKSSRGIIELPDVLYYKVNYPCLKAGSFTG